MLNSAQIFILSYSFYIKYIPIPFELTRGKKNITLKIAARLKNMTGDIFDIRILPSNSEMDLK